MKESFAEYPVMVAVRQMTEIVSWELPLSVPTKYGFEEYLETSRTLCHANMEILKNLPPVAYGT